MFTPSFVRRSDKPLQSKKVLTAVRVPVATLSRRIKALAKRNSGYILACISNTTDLRGPRDLILVHLPFAILKEKVN